MRVLLMKKQYLTTFLEASRQFGELWGPISKGDMYVYDRIDDISKLILVPVRTALPVKKLIHPPEFDMFRYEAGKYDAGLDDIPRRVVYGVPPCDIHGLLILDDLFTRYYPDPYYTKRRERTAILGASFCTPAEGCLCKSMGTDTVEDGFDLFFSDLGDSYLVWVGSSLGDDMVRAKPDLFSDNITRKHLDKFVECKKERDERFTRSIDMTVIPDVMELSYDIPLWKELGEKCLECGACTMVCPTCNCYNIVDEPSISGSKEVRKRHWDCCIYAQYSLVAGGHNFRQTRGERLRLWYTHKLKSFGYSGSPSCVGCGRCIDTCPVDINVLVVARSLLGKGDGKGAS